MTTKNGLPTIRVKPHRVERRNLITTLKQTPSEKKKTMEVAKHYGKSVNGLLNEAIENLHHQAFGSGISE